MRFYYLIFLSFLYLPIFSQPTLQWYKELGGFSEETATCVLTLADGNILFAAQSASNEGDITCGNYGNKDVILFKYDAQGNLLWQKHYGGTEDDLVTSLIELPDGDIVFCGYTQSSDIDISNAHGNFDYWLVRLAADGTKIWSKTYGGTNLDVATQVQMHSNGGFLLGGYAHSIDGDKSQALGNSDFWVVHTDSIGDIVWEKSFGGSADDRLYGLCSAYNGGFLLAGEAFSTDGDVLTPNGAGDMLVLNIDDNGNVLWQKNYGASLSDYVSTIQQDKLGGYYVAGKTYSNNGIFTGNHGKLDFSLIRITENGDLIWTKTWGGTENDLAYQLITTGQGKWAMIGDSYSNNGDVGQNKGNADVWLITGDSLGNVLWNKNLGGNDKDQGFAICAESDQTFYLAGMIRSTTFQETVFHGNGDILFAKLATASQLSPAFPSTEIDIQIDEVLQQINVRNLPSSHTQIILSNIIGQIIVQQDVTNSNFSILRPYLSTGVYALHIQTEGYAPISRVFYWK